MSRYYERQMKKSDREIREDAARQLEIEGVIKVVITIAICLLLVFAAYKGTQMYNDNYYDVVVIEGHEYSELDHDVYIDPSEKFVRIDGKRYGWSWVQKIERREK